jgi:hypothetical protein
MDLAADPVAQIHPPPTRPARGAASLPRLDRPQPEAARLAHLRAKLLAAVVAADLLAVAEAVVVGVVRAAIRAVEIAEAPPAPLLMGSLVLLVVPRIERHRRSSRLAGEEITPDGPATVAGSRQRCRGSTRSSAAGRAKSREDSSTMGGTPLA